MMRRHSLTMRWNVICAMLLGFALWAVWGTGGAPPVLAAPVGQNLANTQPVFALPGTLRPAQNQTFDTYLVANDGKLYGLAGETPALEGQIVAFRNLPNPVTVKVWGTLYPQGRNSSSPEIVVAAIQAADPSQLPTAVPTATPTPTATPRPATPTITVIVRVLNVRTGPDVGYPRVGGLTLGETCAINGRNQTRTWWRIRCDSGLAGWVSAGFVTTNGDLANVPVIEVPPPPPPTATPTPPPPVSFTNWKATFYSNRDLAGEPAAVLDVPDVRFNWGTGAPAANIPPDNFSIRFERTLSFATGVYELAVNVDDGARLYLDNQLIIDGWQELSVRRLAAQRTLSGSHYLRIDYFEAYGNAQIDFVVNLVNANSDWRVAYYGNPDLRGDPILTRGEPRGNYPIDQNWGAGSPAPGVVGNDNWSARYVGTFDFEGGDYIFAANVDDGVRVYVDGLRVLNNWSDGYKQPTNRFNGLGRGRHEITVEYYERGGGAALRVWWYRTDSSGNGGGGGRPRDE